MRRLERDFYNRDTVDVARDLLGKLLVHDTPTGQRVGRITEAEAYVGTHDLAAHSRRGVTPRTEVMFGPPGHAYVYLIYGMHHCLNVVTEPQGNGCAVLLRALEPVAGIALDTRGPGLLCRAMGVDLSNNRADLCGSSLFVAEDARPTGKILATPRIGVDYAAEWAHAPLRFLLADSEWVSGKKRRAKSASST
jgi:DNA-3-methyladenine glycosylase